MQSVRTLSRHCPIGESKRLPPSPITGCVSHGGTGLLIGPEIAGALDRRDRRQSDPGTVDPALDRADGAPADLRRLFVRKSGGADQDAGFALLSRQLLQRLAEVLHFRVIELIGSNVKDPA